MDITKHTPDAMHHHACQAAGFLKAIGHEGRLLILCHLTTGEKTVSALETLLSARQAAVSQHLSRLRQEGLVIPRREGKAIYYSLTDERIGPILTAIRDMFRFTP